MDVATLDSHRCLTTTESGSVSYVDVGRGRPAVFIHGIFTNAVLWRKVIGAVASDDRRCIAIELPGHGRTPPALEQADVSITGLARRVIELCNHLGLQRFDLVANDTGGAIAQVVAAESSDRIATLSLTNCDTERNTPPTLFRPIAFIARPKGAGRDRSADRSPPRTRTSTATAGLPRHQRCSGRSRRCLRPPRTRHPDIRGSVRPARCGPVVGRPRRGPFPTRQHGSADTHRVGNCRRVLSDEMGATARRPHSRHDGASSNRRRTHAFGRRTCRRVHSAHAAPLGVPPMMLGSCASMEP
ncbi:MAG: hypothetical protein QOJ80_3586 [Mycobacterium sp.]|nr:hypothetical protein [Mycobacterium sp.]